MSVVLQVLMFAASFIIYRTYLFMFLFFFFCLFHFIEGGEQ